jgi:hypothetical protein
MLLWSVEQALVPGWAMTIFLATSRALEETYSGGPDRRQETPIGAGQSGFFFDCGKAKQNNLQGLPTRTEDEDLRIRKPK